MYKLKTTSEKQVPDERGFVMAIVRLVIDRIEIDNNNIKASGYYYRLGENNEVIKLSELGNSAFKLWDEVEQVENAYLENFDSTKSLKANILQRVKEFTHLQLAEESGQNWGIIVQDWVEDNS
jgi:hypothetical protein